MAQKKQSKQTVVRLGPSFHLKLKQLAANKATTMQALVESALSEKYGWKVQSERGAA